MGLSGASAINSFSLGEIVSNTIQPFWALPMLGVAGLKIKDIWGYCFIAFVALFVVWGLCIAVLL
jgi:short-chain fatty acids transporter